MREREADRMPPKGKRDIARVHNDMLKAPLGILNEAEINILLKVLCEIKDKGKSSVMIPFSDFRGKRNTTSRELIALMESTADKLQKFRIQYKDNEGTQWREVIFPRVGINNEKRAFVVETTDSFAYIVNYVLASNNFTQLSYSEVSNVSGKYTKIIYWYLKRFSDVGVWGISLNDFVETLNIPGNYSMQKIRLRVINPAMEELEKHFPNLSCYERTGKRNKVEQLMFVYDAEPKATTNRRKREKYLTLLGFGEWRFHKGKDNRKRTETVDYDLDTANANGFFCSGGEFDIPF